MSSSVVMTAPLGARKQIAHLQHDHGFIDVDHLGEKLKKALTGSPVGRAELEKIAGEDRQIRGEEFLRLAEAIDPGDGFTKSPTAARDLRRPTVGSPGTELEFAL